MPASRTWQVIMAATVVGCSPYDPDLGSQPYLCTIDNPQCPDGYVCVERPGRDDVCQRDQGSQDGGLDGQCTADATEPNETIEAPTVVPIPELGETHMLAAAICPETDLDIYRVNVDVTGKNLRVEVGYDSSRGPLAVDLLNSVGVSIRTATPTNGDSNKLRADFDNLATGFYYGRVRGTNVRAGYDISFVVTSGNLPP